MKSVFILVAMATFVAFSHAATDKVVCYYGSWAVYREYNHGKFDVEDISTELCTHIIYSFLGINHDGTIRILDPWHDTTQKGFERFRNLTSRNPNIKCLIAIGGWNEGSDTFSSVVNNPNLRTTFVNSIVDFVTNYGYDGVDLDWEYPGQRGGNTATDRTAFVSLLQELRASFDPKGWLLTAAVGATKQFFPISYDVPQLSQYLDMINVMTYDLHGAWDGKTGQNAPLYASQSDTSDEDKSLNVDACITAWIAAGADPAKLILGMAPYGRTFTLASSSNNGIGAPTSGAGIQGPYTHQAGFLGYFEICEAVKTGGWTKIWDDVQKNPYLYKGNQWVGYDNVRSIEIKSRYAVAKNLGGVMIASIETDDYIDSCGGGKFPLLTAINNVLKELNQITTTSSTTTPTICSAGGYVRDAYNCALFYYCYLSGNNEYLPVEFKCSEGLYFDTTSRSCNYKDQVTC